MTDSIMDMKPTCASSWRTTVSSAAGATAPAFFSRMGKDPGGRRREGCSFSQPRLTTMTSLPKFGLSVMLRSVRIGTFAPGASIATPQP
jgi:hypothetical protein